MALFIDDKKVGGVKELCEALKLDPKSIPYTKRVKEFQMTMELDIHGNVKRDRDGNYITKRNITGSPQFSVNVPKLGYEVRIRLAQTQRKDKDGIYTYTPNIIAMMPGEDGVTQFNDELEFAFWFLHPWNKHSPFKDVNKAAFFEYKDNDAASKFDNDQEEWRVMALSYILGPTAKSIRELRAIAKGLNFTGVDDMTDDVLKKTLRLKASADPVWFVNQLDSREVAFSGMIQDAIDKNILKLQNMNGMSRWYLNEKEILPIAYGLDPLITLKQELVDKWHLYSKEIQDALNGLSIQTKLNSADMDEYFEPKKEHITQRAEVTPEQEEVLKKMREEEWYNDKIKKLAEIDLDDPKLHHGTRSSYEKNKEAVEAYKATLVSDLVTA